VGELIGGRWYRTGVETSLVSGTLKREPSVYRNWVTADGAEGFKAERDRYHLYVSLACPWAHRTLMMRSLKGLGGIIDVSVVHWLMGDDGWTFSPAPGVVPDMVNGVSKLHEIYTLADSSATTRVTVPVLWDKVKRTIVSNESSEIIRMFNSAFDHLGAQVGDYYPAVQRTEIDAVNERVYAGLNNGVYMAGLAARQSAYDEAVSRVFDTLDWLEERLSGQRYLMGADLTEADVRVFTTLVRFDAVYHGHFKCNHRVLIEYPALWDYTRDLFQHPDIRPTVNFNHIKSHYYRSHAFINPTGIVPSGPIRDFDAPVNRAKWRAARS
jgi:putative glutathione S-transferase